ncbi:MAG: cellulose binding domain-containing protein, partial [Terracidiphilus sp.]
GGEAMKLTHPVSTYIARLCIILSAIAGLSFGGVIPKALGQTGFTYNGIVRAVYSDSDLGTSGDSTYVSFVQSTHANYVAITIEWFVQSNTGTTIAASSTDSATDAQIVAAIEQYHNLGIKVVLKPQVDIVGYPSWRGELAPSSISAWFTSYQAYITHYAQLAKANNVDALSIGTELKSLSVSANLSFWETLISAVRADYSGPIMYGANATGAGDEYSTVSFWSLVDIIGVDGYFGLTDLDNPTVAQLESAWTDSTSTITGAGFNAVAALKNLNSQYGKPVVFTEIGYESSEGTNEEPYAQISNGYDPTEQEDCYTAFFDIFSAQSSWMKGVFWWDLQLPVPGADDQSWVMYGKPAGTVVLPQWFGGTSSPTFTLAPSASSVSVTQGSSATDTITVTDEDGFTGSVTFTATGLPSGVTASFSPASSASSSVLTLTASSSATTGSATVTITGTSGSTTATTTIALTVNAKAAAGFTLAPSASSLSVTQGSSATDTITVTDSGGFTGSVTFTATGLPSGVTASFSPTASTSSSVLTLTASSSATIGSAAVTIKGTLGSTTASTTITVSVSSSGTGTGTKCTIDYTISPQNSSAFGAAIGILNTGSTAISSWTLTWTFANGQTVASLWNGVETQSGANVTVTNESYNGSIPAGGSYTGMGFNGTWNGSTNAIPTAFSLNGTACTVN